MTDTSRIPRLVSDITRGWVAVSIAIVIVTIAVVVMVFTVDDMSVERVTWSGMFLLWGVLAIATTVLTAVAFHGAESDQLHRWLAATTPETRAKRIMWSINGGGAVSWALTGSFIAVAAVLLLTRHAEFRTDPFIVWPAVGVVLGSFTMMITAYAVRYARENATGGGAEFPSTPHPRFTEYVYLAVQVATTFGGSDVTFTGSRMRRVVSVHSLFAFAFNTVIVALLVSVLISTVD